MKEKINVLCATDNNYAPYCGVMLTSLFENNKESQVCIFVMFDDELSHKNKSRFLRLGKKYKQTISFIKVDKTTFTSYFNSTQKRWSVATYYRLLDAELLPHDIHKVLYLDCDIIVTSNIKHLFNINLEDKAIAGALDVSDADNSYYQRLEYSEQYHYINAGVVLLNLDYWREYNIGVTCLEFMKSNHEKLLYNDQDVLNAVLWNKKVLFPITYNFEILFLDQTLYQHLSVSVKQEVWQTIDAPKIIHYSASSKPWMLAYNNLFQQQWLHYKRHSPWWHIQLKFPRHKVINYILKRYVFWPLGLLGTVTKEKLYHNLKSL